MQILFVTDRFPWPLEDGGNLRTFHILNALCLEHDVTLLSHAPAQRTSESIETLKRLCKVHVVDAPSLLRTSAEIVSRPWRWTQSLFILKNWSRPLFEKSRQLLIQYSFDAVHFNHLDAAVFRTRENWPMTVFDSHNCVSTMAAQLATEFPNRLKAKLYRRESSKLSAAEKSVCELCDTVLACSEQDQQAFLKLAPSANVHVVPNGVNTESFEESPPETEKLPSQVQRLVFTGAMDYAPNVAGVEWFCREVFPLIQKQNANTLFQIVGRNPTLRVGRLANLRPAERNGSLSHHDEMVGVKVTGRVDSVAPYLQSAAVVIVPLLHGGGTRLKILEAFAAKRPVVSTSKGAEGIEAVSGKEILIADQPENFANAVIRLLNDSFVAKQIGTAGYQLAEEKYDWRIVGKKVRKLYQQLNKHVAMHE